MATRQEIATGYSIGTNAFRLGGTMHMVELQLQGLGTDGQPMTMPKVDIESIRRLASLSEIKNKAKSWKANCLNLANSIEATLTKPDLSFITKSLKYYTLSRPDIEDDLRESKTLCIGCSDNLIDNRLKLKDLKGLATPFIQWNPRNVRNFSAANIPRNIRQEIMLHDLLDALSYNFQGIHHNTGQKGCWIDAKILKGLGKARLRAADICINNIPDKVEIADLLPILNYIKDNLEDAKDLVDFKLLGQYIDANLEKLTLVRRAWAWQ